MAAFVAVFFATRRVVIFLPFFVVARWTILPAPGTVTRVVRMTAFLVTFTFALVVVKAAVGNPMAYVQMKAGHSQSQITERYIHAAQVLFPGAAAKGEARMFALTGGPGGGGDDGEEQGPPAPGSLAP